MAAKKTPDCTSSWCTLIYTFKEPKKWRLTASLSFCLTWGENHWHILHLVVTQTELLPVKYITEKMRTKYVKTCIMCFNHWNVFKTHIRQSVNFRKCLKKLFSSKPSFISTLYKISVLTFPPKTSSAKKTHSNLEKKLTSKQLMIFHKTKPFISWNSDCLLGRKIHFYCLLTCIQAYHWKVSYSIVTCQEGKANLLLSRDTILYYVLYLAFVVEIYLEWNQNQHLVPILQSP